MAKQDYLFKRKGSSVWQLRLVTPAAPGEKRSARYISTGHRDYADALEWATPEILIHLRSLVDRQIAARPGCYMKFPHEPFPDPKVARANLEWLATQIKYTEGPELEAGAHNSLPDGGHEECSEDGTSIAMFNTAGKYVGSRPNEQRKRQLYIGNDRTHREIRDFQARIARNNPHVGESLDERMIQSWATHEGVQDEVVKETRRAYAQLKTIAPMRNFGTFRPQDVHGLVALWRKEKSNASSTMAKRMGLLRAVVHHSMDNARKSSFPEIKGNVFTGDYVPRGIKGHRAPPLPFDPADHALIMADLPSWPLDQQRLYLLGRCLGLSAIECWQITEEETVRGVRCVVVRGTKNDYRLRNIPIPDALLPYLPAKITGSLFKHGESYVNRQMMKRIRELLAGGDTKIDGKTHHSLRHGLETDLGNLGVHPFVVSAILGHVPDDLKMNKGENQQIRAKKSVRYQYFHGNTPGRLLDALNLIKLHLGPAAGAHQASPEASGSDQATSS